MNFKEENVNTKEFGIKFECWCISVCMLVSFIWQKHTIITKILEKKIKYNIIQ